MKDVLDKQKTQELLKQELGWDNPNRCQDGFWLDKHTFLIADKVEVVKLDRHELDGESKNKPIPMLVLHKVVEMVIGNDQKIISVETKETLGLWLDALSYIVKNPVRTCAINC